MGEQTFQVTQDAGELIALQGDRLLSGQSMAIEIERFSVNRKQYYQIMIGTVSWTIRMNALKHRRENRLMPMVAR